MKKTLASIPLIVLLCCLVGCQDQAAMAELEEFRAQAELEKQNKDLAREFLRDLDAGNFDAVTELHDSNFVLHMAGSAEPIKLADADQLMRGFYTSISQQKHVIELIIGEGDKVVIMTTTHGSHDGEFIGIPPSGVDVEFSQVIIWRITNEKIVEAWEVVDMLSLMQQLGMEVRPKE
jgi:predicted ester cyclase